jgi:hypothetical protein
MGAAQRIGQHGFPSKFRVSSTAIRLSLERPDSIKRQIVERSPFMHCGHDRAIAEPGSKRAIRTVSAG